MVAVTLELSAGPGLTAGVHQGCSIIGERNGLLLHDCDTKGGASGGPLLGKVDDQYDVIALHAGWQNLDGKVRKRKCLFLLKLHQSMS